MALTAVNFSFSARRAIHEFAAMHLTVNLAGDVLITPVLKFSAGPQPDSCRKAATVGGETGQNMNDSGRTLLSNGVAPTLRANLIDASG